MKNIPTIDFARGLSNYKLDTLIMMEPDYKAAVNRMSKGIFEKGEDKNTLKWATGRHLAIKREIQRRKDEQ